MHIQAELYAVPSKKEGGLQTGGYLRACTHAMAPPRASYALVAIFIKRQKLGSEPEVPAQEVRWSLEIMATEGALCLSIFPCDLTGTGGE